MLPIRDLNPSRRLPVVTVALIAANGIAFLYELSLGLDLQRFLMASAFVPERLFAPAGGGDVQLGGALLSMFLHGGWAHLLGNMLFLWIFGDNVEDRLGHVRFLLFYLLCGMVATYAHAFANPRSVLPTVGASGAIAGVLGAYLVLYPKARVVTLVILGFFIQRVELPVLLYLPLWFLLQFVSGLASLNAATSAEAGGVAWFAHIGGFIAGPVLLLLLGGLRSRRPRRRSGRDWR
ncbi:MAG TPA: rhomboid family intramembrane serine protease [Thermoanaerobaculia bacterium]|nr:rhomboid family intramembrane serine protease [Thermoanaerobaculia bacterium]